MKSKSLRSTRIRTRVRVRIRVVARGFWREQAGASRVEQSPEIVLYCASAEHQPEEPAASRPRLVRARWRRRSEHVTAVGPRGGRHQTRGMVLRVMRHSFEDRSARAKATGRPADPEA
jgi:hypothetical protein